MTEQKDAAPNLYRVSLPYTESAQPQKAFKIEYNMEAPDRELAIRKAEREFMSFTQYSSASWIRTIDKDNIRAWRILPDLPQTAPAIDEFAKNFEALDQDTVYNVLKKLGELEDSTFIPRVLPLLKHQDSDLAALAAETLGKIGNATCVASLIEMFQPSAPARMKACVLSSLSRIATSKDSIEEIVAHGLGDPDSRVRANAVELVERLHLSGIARQLVPMLGDQDNRVRANVLKALWSSHDRRLLTSSLQEMIKSPNRWMRISAAFVLQHIECEEQLSLLAQLLADSEPDVQKSARKTLFGKPDISRIPLWIEHWNQDDTLADLIATQVFVFGHDGWTALLAFRPADPERKALVQRLVKQVGGLVYQQKGVGAWLTFKYLQLSFVFF